MMDARSADQGRPTAGSRQEAEIGLVLAQLVRSEVASPVDAAALTRAALAGAVRIRRRRTTLTGAAAVVLLAVPVALTGLRLGQAGGHAGSQPGGPAVVAAGEPGATASRDSSVAGVGPMAPSPTTTNLPTVRFTATGGQPVVVTFTPRTRALEASTATTTYPAVTVAGGPPAVRRQVQAALGRRVATLVAGYGQRVKNLRAADSSPVQSIRVSGTTSWRHTVTIVLEGNEEIPGALPRTATTAAVLDTRSGTAVEAGALLTDVAAADAFARKAVAAAMPPGAVEASRLTNLTMRNDPGSGAEAVAWYPSGEGITWVVDTDGSNPELPGPIIATVPWTSLDGLLREALPR